MVGESDSSSAELGVASSENRDAAAFAATWIWSPMASVPTARWSDDDVGILGHLRSPSSSRRRMLEERRRLCGRSTTLVPTVGRRSACRFSTTAASRCSSREKRRRRPNQRVIVELNGVDERGEHRIEFRAEVREASLDREHRVDLGDSTRLFGRQDGVALRVREHLRGTNAVVVKCRVCCDSWFHGCHSDACGECADRRGMSARGLTARPGGRRRLGAPVSTRRSSTSPIVR